MSVIQIALFIIILILLLIAFRNTRRLKGGIYTSWRPTIDNSKYNDEYRALIDRITEVIKEHIENSDYDYDKMRDEVKTETDYQKAIVDSLFAELKKVKIETYKQGGIQGDIAFRAMFIGLVEAYIHLYIIHGFKLQLERSIHAGSFNIVIFCNRDYVLRIRTRSYREDERSGVIQGSTFMNASDEKLKENNRIHKYLYEAFRNSNRILKPICSSALLYHDYDYSFIVEWALNDRLDASKNPIQNPETFNDYINCLLESNHIAHSIGLTYLDYKIENILWNQKTNCYCIADIDFAKAEEIDHDIAFTHAIGIYFSYDANKYKSNYIILKEIASIHSSQDIESYNQNFQDSSLLEQIPYSINEHKFKDEDLEPLIKRILNTKIN